MFMGWKINSWNTTEDPCSSGAITSSSSDDDGNVEIRCNCNFVNSTICHIIELKVHGKSVQGQIPEDLIHMAKLIKLNLSSNLLTGPLPKELGNLTNLISLDLSVNKFNGSLPGELGNLSNLEELKLDSVGVNGIIPMSFNKLQKLRILQISDNDFNGSLPNFLGLLTGLEDLRLQGNNFQGPIPPSFANLTKLNRLQIGELLGTSSNLQFIQNMTLLNILILRNTNISGSIPSFLGKFEDLNHLDLSFNNLSGQLPPSIFKMPALEFMFLGNNSLTGSLPSNKSSRLLNIDLSYNKLSGSFPSWVNETHLNLNLVANNFFIDNSNNSLLPGLRCLQRSIPCHLNSPIQNSFAINCGGHAAVNSNSGPSFEIDNADLSTASYYVTETASWAVSTVGRFLDVGIPTYIQNTLSGFSNTQESQLFQSSRLSPSSIRYYGLGLQNGNYTVKLFFGESDNWIPSEGRRLFDIYLQGMLVEKDFDITKRANNRTLVTVEVPYQTTVTANFLEIHLFWAGKGTCCIPNNGNYGPSISAIKVTSNFSLLNDKKESSNGKTKGLIAGIIATVVVLFSIIVLASFAWRWKRKMREEDVELLGLAGKLHSFTYQELRTSTDDFCPANKLGAGGFGSVYKGILSDGKVVAVKQLSELSDHGKKQFITEIATISAVQHRNLVKLHGCCYDGNRRLLVLEYLDNGSLEKILFGISREILDWPVRFRICIGVAKGLAYLHEESDPRIIHRDVKASNILLDADLNPKLSDFGIAKLHDDKKSHLSTGVAGTVGYLAPEYAMKGQLTEKADVFSFGVLLFEILCGRKNVEPGLETERIYLLEWVWHLHHEKRDMEMLDPVLSSYNECEALRVMGVAFMCTQAPPSRRPAMSRVVSMLVGDVDVVDVLARPSYLLDWRYATDATASTSTSTTLSFQVSLPTSSTSLMTGIHTIGECR